MDGDIREVDDLAPILYNYIKANQMTNQDSTRARYQGFSVTGCEHEIKMANQEINRTSTLSEKYLTLDYRFNKWKSRLSILNFLELKNYRFIHETHYVLIKVKAKTSYQMYINVISAIKETINKLREEKAQELFNMSYKKILANKKNKKMRSYANVLKILVPERIMETSPKN